MAKPVYDSDADEWVWVYEEEIEIETSGGSYRVPAKLSEEQRAFVREYYGVNQEPRTRVFRDFGTWATRPGLNDDDNPLLRAAKAKLVEVEAKKRIPAKSGPPQLILDEPAPWQAARARASKPGWADEIAHEVAEEERERQNERLLAAAKKLEQQPELMVDLCELRLRIVQDGDAAFWAKCCEIFWDPPPYHMIDRMMGLFAIDCLCPADSPGMRHEYQGYLRNQLMPLLHLAKQFGWGGLKD